MDRKGIIAVTLAILTLIGWTYWTSKDMQKIAAAQAAEARAKAEAALKAKALEPEAPPQAAAGKSADAAGKPADASGKPPNGGDAPPSEPSEPEKIETLSGPSVDYAFSNLGGGIATATLKTHEAERGTRMVLNEFGSIPIGAVSEAAGEGTRVPFSTVIDSANGTATFDRTDSRQVQITKKFTIPKSRDLDKDYIATLEITLTNHGAQPLAIPTYYVHTGSAAPVHQSDQSRYTGFTWAGGKFKDANSFSGSWFSGPERLVFTAAQEGIAWAAVADQYFTTMVIPEVTGQDPAAQGKQRGNSVWARRFVIDDATWKKSGRGAEGSTAARWAVDGALGMPAVTLEPDKPFTQKFRIYAGPREYGRLRLMPDGEADVMNYGWFAPVSKMLLLSMNWLHARLGSYAWAIVVLTLLIKCILWPMQNKATQSMKRMQLLTPKMTELKEKYKDDPTKMNTELMKLYKIYGVNPLGGCLPMFIQLPVFWGFYSVLGTAVELRNSKFFWVQDLSQPDTVFHLSGIGAGLGFPVNVLPLCMAATMFWQMRISPKSGDPSQQKMFMFMPLIFVAFCYNYASALALYWTVQNLFSVAQLYVTRNQAPPTLQKVAAPAKRK
jgi:YidC/Oxa1 family membrane protein insertase